VRIKSICFGNFVLQFKKSTTKVETKIYSLRVERAKNDIRLGKFGFLNEKVKVKAFLFFYL